MWQALAAQAAGNIVGNALSGHGQVKGARAATEQIKQGMAENTAMAKAQRQEQQQLQSPYMQTGQRAMGDYEAFRMREAGPYEAGSFSGVNMGEDPGVQYRMEQAQKALDQSASRRGSLFSGAQKKALQANAQNLASQEFQNAYGRQYGQFKDTEDARRQQSNLEADRMMNYDQYRMNQLQGLTNLGQTATGQLSSAYGNIGANQVQNQMLLRGQQADVSAARAAAPWNAASNAFTSSGNALGNYFMSK